MTRAPEALRPIRLRPGVRIGAVVSLYHAEVGAEMLGSARDVLTGAGLEQDDLLVVEVPGAFELPLVAGQLAAREDIDAVLCLGLVLRGETTHDEHIARAVTDALQRIALEELKPVLFGLLTCNTMEQARARSLSAARGGTHDKGAEVARAALGALAAQDRLEELADGGSIQRRTRGTRRMRGGTYTLAPEARSA